MSVQTVGRIPEIVLRVRLRVARESAGLEQEDIANALEISRGSVSAYERGVTTPKGLVLRAWALVTGVDEQWLRTGRPAPDSPTDGLRMRYTTPDRDEVAMAA